MGNKYFSTEAEYKRQLIKELVDICTELKWEVAVIDSDENEEVQGLIVGTEEYIQDIVDSIDDLEDEKLN